MAGYPWRRLLLTLLGLAAYQLCHLIPLPTVAADSGDLALGPLPDARWSIVALGIAPFLTGFLLVELFSLLVPPGRRVRAQGVEGRRKLTRWSVGLSAVIAILQALSLHSVLQKMSSASGAPIMDSGLGSSVVTLFTLVAGSMAVYALGRWMTVQGLGNGFCWLFFADVSNLHVLLDHPHRPGFQLHEGSLQTLLVIALILAFLVQIFRRPAGYRVTLAEDREIRLELPALPQGLVPVSWAMALLVLPDIIDAWFGTGGEPYSFDLRTGSLGLLFLVPLLSILTLQLFSSERRVTTNLPPAAGDLASDFGAVLRKRFVATTAILTLLVAGERLAVHFLESGYLIGTFFLTSLAAFGLDVVEEWHFRSRRDAVGLVEVDNVHLASFLKAFLEDEGIPCTVQASRFRSLFFFFQPLYKMVVLVPSDRLDEARDRWEEIGARIV